MTLPEAIALARRLHDGAVDKGGRPYFEHPLRVMNRVSTLEEKLAAVLHDVLEDTGVSTSHLVAAGCPERVLQALEALTRRSEEPYDAFVARAAADPLARVVKRADIEDNLDPRRLARLDPVEADRLREKYARALAILESTTPREPQASDVSLLEPAGGGPPGLVAGFDCRACGLPAGRVELQVFPGGGAAPALTDAAATVTATSFLGRSVSRVEPEQIDRIAAAIAACDGARLRRADLALFWCPDCQGAYCSRHWVSATVMDEGFYDYTEGICPEGHRAMIDD